MAIIKTSGLITDIRGRVGGSIFQNGSSGLILRSGTRNINKRSLSMTIQRNFTFMCQQEWMLLTTVERASWSNLISYQPIKQNNISGKFINAQQTFIMANVYRLQYGEAILKTPKFAKCKILPIDLQLSLSAGELTVTASRVMASADEFIVLYLAYPTPITINNPGNRLRLIIFNTTDTDVFTISTPYQALFGFLPTAGQTVFMEWTNVNKYSGIPFPFQSSKTTL